MPIERLFGYYIFCIPASYPHLGLYIGDERCSTGLLCWLSHCVWSAGHLYKGLRISIPFQDSSDVFLFDLYILPLGDGSRSVEEVGDNALFHKAWVVKGEVQISVCVGGLSVNSYVKESTILAVEECVLEG